MQATLSLPSARRTPVEQSVLADSAVSHPVLAHDLSVDSELLLRGKKSVSIVHNGATYRLQSTKLGKLILTK
ncbi:MAG: hemin uptake protein HemP [Comamonas sp.]|jgi:hemin uptake protein HemP|uniref:hemin uptake protein HemP n=1 Tax=Comamonas sp. TaxID=34028 RepID=UPI000FAD2E23|nr:hemin uptake protein HemP [Comamonas sp.]